MAKNSMANSMFLPTLQIVHKPGAQLVSFWGGPGGVARGDKVSVEWTDPAGGALMFAGALRLCFVGQNHFMYGVAAGDGGVEYRHGNLLFQC